MFFYSDSFRSGLGCGLVISLYLYNFGSGLRWGSSYFSIHTVLGKDRDASRVCLGDRYYKQLTNRLEYAG